MTAPPPVSIRPARLSDGIRLQEIERLSAERFRSVGMPAIADDEPAGLDVLADYTVAGRAWVAVDRAEDPVGYVVVDVVDGCVHVEQISVVPDHQGRGVGRALLDEVVRWAAETDRPAVTLTTFADVPWNRPLYEHLGFRTLALEEIGEGLSEVRRREAAHGLDPALRVCMRLDVEDWQTPEA